ncbi:hypothetical protein KEM48_008045 [Puccinia striiformis f. sp. tritici PST-130]|nr:hypothetical protein KEM48_008045 [Puccinia striiformis f. sp. tritici PST-130]
MEDGMESVLTNLSSEHALSTNDKDYPSTCELSEPPELNPIPNIEDDTESLLTELSSQLALLQTPEDYDSDSSDSSEESFFLECFLLQFRFRRFCGSLLLSMSPINAHEHSTSAKKDELGIPTRPDKRELTEKQQAGAKKRRNQNWSKKRSKKKLPEANEN